MISIELFMIISTFFIPLISLILILAYYFDIYEKKKGLIISFIILMFIGYIILLLPLNIIYLK